VPIGSCPSENRPEFAKETEIRFAVDSPLEEAGFELLVPLDIDAARAGQMTGNPSGKSPEDLESQLQRRLMKKRRCHQR
jgi:hypothetical protein